MVRFFLSVLLVIIGAFSYAQDYHLALGGTRFDPLQELPPAAGPWSTFSQEGSQLWLVQMQGPIQADWTDRLEQGGLRIVQYLHPYTYIIWGEAAELERQRADHIRWTGAFLPAYRVLPQYRLSGEKAVPVGMLHYRGADRPRFLADLSARGAREVKHAVLDKRFEMFTCLLRPDQFAQVARRPGLYTLQLIPGDGGDRGEMSAMTIANQIIGGTVSMGYSAWLSGIGLDGSGVVAGTVDSGVLQTHADLSGAFLPCSGPSCEDNVSGHGTHVAGILGGRATSGITGAQGFLRGQGVAPGADLIEQYYPGIYLNAGGLLQIMQDSVQNGAVLSSNSWGTTANAIGYDMGALQLDLGVRDADSETIGHQPLTYVIAIENGRGGTSSQGAPEEAKNALRVGSTWMRENSGAQRSDLGSISDNSAHGPALDGRLLPDIVAPGKMVDATASSGGYEYRGGTSMAAPGVAGGAALFYEYYRGLPHNPSGFDPSPAMVKAALIAPSIDLEGGTDADGAALGHRFDNKQGWGRLNLEAVLDPADPVAYYDVPVVFQGTGESWSADLTVADTARPVYIMMVYTDAPGHGLGGATPAWNNNLDLEVDYNGQTLLGNVLGPDGWSTSGGAPDGANNTEGVLIGPTAPTTALTLRVEATNLSSDGVPGSGTATDQDFALVCYNCRQDADYLLVANLTNQTVCAGTDAVFQVNVGQLGGFDQPVNLSTAGLPAGATAMFSTNPVTAPGGTTLTIAGTAALSTGNYAFQILGSGGGIDHSLDLLVRVEEQVPPAVTLSAPLNGAADQSTSPLFRWQLIEGAGNYEFQLAADAGFTSVLHSQTQTANEYDYPESLNYSTTYYWRVRTENPCGIGDWSTGFSFETQAGPSLLIVDDDNNLPDVRDFFTEAVAFWGVAYDLWDVALNQGEPDAVFLSQYDAVLWFSGDANNFSGLPLAGPGEDGENALSTWLDGGGNLILFAQHYLLDREGLPFGGPNAFMSMYLGLDSAMTSTINNEVTGTGAIFGDLGPYNLNPQLFTARPDTVNPDGTAEAIFVYEDASNGGLMKDSGVYKTFFMPWPFSGLPEANRLTLIDRLLLNAGVFGDTCRNEDNFLAKLPFWPDDQDALSLIECINNFLVP